MLFAPLFALALAAQAPTAAADTPASQPAMAPASLPMAQQFDLASKITGRTYRIYISRPTGPPPKGGYPVIYVLDGDMAFPTAAAQVLLGAIGGRPQAIVVGIAYPNVMATMTLRNRDLTPWPPDAAMLQPGEKADDYGGADAFHRAMMEELRPIVARTYPVDPANQTLMGYSYGGLFTLHVLFHHPEAYRTYVAGSPSIWFNGRELLKSEAAFTGAVRAGKVAPRVLITSDSWEQAAESPDVPASGKARADVLKMMNDDRMVDLATRLQALKGPPGYRVQYALFPRETHNSGIPASTSRGVAFSVLP
ncbi:alpha/beta hydrolase-fold protein [Phenylobacterium sp.]|uniref:alpha/beta hydrolase n=1 Tax=Phenylobacterium sp. TaxID=1871053 RepID=UPI0025EA4922|nr:alpha/beta hydrolase-fold protein [Phenylobacterium sp.]